MVPHESVHSKANCRKGPLIYSIRNPTLHAAELEMRVPGMPGRGRKDTLRLSDALREPSQLTSIGLKAVAGATEAGLPRDLLIWQSSR
jgi:hypothetical protein